MRILFVGMSEEKKHSAVIYYAWDLVNSVQCSYTYLSEKTQNK